MLLYRAKKNIYYMFVIIYFHVTASFKRTFADGLIFI